MELESNMLTNPPMPQPYSLDETEKTNLHILKAASQHQGRGLLLCSGQMATTKYIYCYGP